MNFANNMYEKITSVSQSTVQKAKDFSQLSKLNNAVHVAEKQINELYEKIGCEIYKNYSEAPIPEVEDCFTKVKNLLQTIEICKMQIEELTYTKTCVKCGAKISKDMIFCDNCAKEASKNVSHDNEESVITEEQLSAKKQSDVVEPIITEEQLDVVEPVITEKQPIVEEQPLICSNCGTKNSGDSVFCTSCGQRFE